MKHLPFLRDVDLNKPYDPKLVEQPLYAWWEEQGFFAPSEAAPRPPFVISIPPPNITGELHLGHAMCVAIEDLMIRWRRMQGYKTLWVPGTDHAGIATQLQVEKLLASEGTSRQAIGREEFLRRTWEWKAKYGGIITSQLRRLGASCDWSRERFTLDEGLSRAVHVAFKRLYDDGLIYRGTYLVNWSPSLQTAVSDLEVEYQPHQGWLWYVRYPLLPAVSEGNNGDQAGAPGPTQPWGSGAWDWGATEYITVATTRPETILGDTAVAVHPQDSRYAHLIGRWAVLPVLGRRIPIIADEYVDQTFGTGAVKITPAHDPNDYEVGKRHHLPMITIMNRDATLNHEAGPYAGMDRFEGRKALVADLEREGLLVKVEPHTSNIGISQRGGEIIEPLLSEQWFLRVEPLAQKAIAAVREGRTRIIPEHFERVYLHWLEHIRDWCISRQLWWGHRIPVWYLPDGSMVVPGPDEAPPEGAVQDPDVLDTWFSSGLWPFSTLGWPENTSDMQTFYPTSVMETAYDILFFWVARMMMMGCYLTGVEPFHTVYLHGLIRDEHGRKMSKTAGNVINPLDLMETYGTDALRFTQVTSSAPGQDLNLNPQRIAAARNFANKIWNMTRFVVTAKHRIPTLPGTILTEPLPTDAPLAHRWILSRLHRLAASVDRLLEGYHFGEAGRQIHDFLWNEFADWFIEAAKIFLEGEAAQQTLAVLITVLDSGLRMLHPYMPFVTEAAWQLLHEGQTPHLDSPHPETLMYAPYPVADPAFFDEPAERDFALMRDLVVGVRNIRTEYRIEPARWIAATIVGGPHTPLIERESVFLVRMARIDADRLVVVKTLAQTPKQSATLVVGEVEVFLPLSDLIDLEAERARLTRELEELQREVVRREQRLSNPQFLAKAPEAVVQKEREGLATAQASVMRLRERLRMLSDGHDE